MNADRDDFEQKFRERRERGHLPTWYRRRDFLAEYVGKMTGSRWSHRTSDRARSVVDRGDQRLIAAMDAREISVAAAALLAQLPSDLIERCLTNREARKRVLRVLRQPDEASS